MDGFEQKTIDKNDSHAKKLSMTNEAERFKSSE